MLRKIMTTKVNGSILIKKEKRKNALIIGVYFTEKIQIRISE